MKLAELPSRFDELSKDLCVFAEPPWTADSEIILQDLGDKGEIPEDIKSSPFRYFLELFVIDEFIHDLRAGDLTDSEQTDAIIYYAEYDAFPEWLNVRLKH